MRVVLPLFLVLSSAWTALAQDNIGGVGGGAAPAARNVPPWERGLSNPNPGCSGESQAAIIGTIVLILVGLLVGISLLRRRRHDARTATQRAASVSLAPHIASANQVQERIKKLNELREAGLITAEEQAVRRREILKDL